MDIFQVTPSQTRLLHEDSLIATKTQFGGGYAQVTYKGLVRIWEVMFDDSIGAKGLCDIMSWLDRRNPFLWRQPSPHDTDGPVQTRWSVKAHTSTKGVPTMASYDFFIELEGPKFVEMAEQKYGRRDTGFPRVNKEAADI